MAGPLFSVVIPAYNASGRIGPAIESLRSQVLDGDFEVIVVDSGSQSCEKEVRRQMPSALIVRSEERLLPGAARNAGVCKARGDFVAFMSADTQARPGWLAERAKVHRAGFDAVAGSIVNARKGHPVATAEYLLEYSAQLPIAALLREQEIPHALSFRRNVFERLGGYPTGTLTGEDTIFNRKCIRHGVSIGFAPDASLAHNGSTTITAMLSHARTHGRGLAECVELDNLPSALGSPWSPSPIRLFRALFVYPIVGWVAKLRRLRFHARSQLPPFFLLSPLIVAAAVATGVGAWSQLRQLHRHPGSENAADAPIGSTDD